MNSSEGKIRSEGVWTATGKGAVGNITGKIAEVYESRREEPESRV